MDNNKFRWINEPATWCWQQDSLQVITDGATDFWQKTWYGFQRFTGHALVTEVAGDFTFQVRVRGAFTTLYDQAGILLLADDENWLKAGIEYNDGAPAIGSVFTCGHSDWATGIFSGDPADFWLRLSRKGDALRLQYSIDGLSWPLLRLCQLPAGLSWSVGVMCCTPERQGLAVSFTDIQLLPLLDKALHDLT